MFLGGEPRGRDGGGVSGSWVGKIVGNSRIEEKIGEGGCGQVFRGIDLMLDRPVAIKVLHPALAARSDVNQRFRTEARALARLSHPNVATLYSFDRLADTYVMVMEFVEGRTFESLLREDGPMAPGQALPLFLQALEGMHHAHELGVVHRDIKASNLMVNVAGLVKVMDFGVARAIDTEGLTQANQPLGTPEYMSPEQVRGEEIDRRSDIYSLGVLLFKMLTGRLPITGKSPFDVMQSQLGAAPRSLRVLVPTIPTAIEVAVERALEKRREDRFDSADAMRAALERAVDADGYTTPPPSQPDRRTLAEDSPTTLMGDAGSTVPEHERISLPPVGSHAAASPARRGSRARHAALFAMLLALALGFVRGGEPLPPPVRTASVPTAAVGSVAAPETEPWIAALDVAPIAPAPEPEWLPDLPAVAPEPAPVVAEAPAPEPTRAAPAKQAPAARAVANARRKRARARGPADVSSQSPAKVAPPAAGWKIER